jgi:hypothetical protein
MTGAHHTALEWLALDNALIMRKLGYVSPDGVSWAKLSWEKFAALLPGGFSRQTARLRAIAHGHDASKPIPAELDRLILSGEADDLTHGQHCACWFGSESALDAS